MVRESEFKSKDPVFDGGHSSVVRESEFKSKDPVFDPLAGQGEEQFFYISKSTCCADLFVSDPASCVSVYHSQKHV